MTMEIKKGMQIKFRWQGQLLQGEVMAIWSNAGGTHVIVNKNENEDCLVSPSDCFPIEDV